MPDLIRHPARRKPQNKDCAPCAAHLTGFRIEYGMTARRRYLRGLVWPFLETRPKALLARVRFPQQARNGETTTVMPDAIRHPARHRPQNKLGALRAAHLTGFRIEYGMTGCAIRHTRFAHQETQ